MATISRPNIVIVGIRGASEWSMKVESRFCSEDFRFIRMRHYKRTALGCHKNCIQNNSLDRQEDHRDTVDCVECHYDYIP